MTMPKFKPKPAKTGMINASTVKVLRVIRVKTPSTIKVIGLPESTIAAKQIAAKAIMTLLSKMNEPTFFNKLFFWFIGFLL